MLTTRIQLKQFTILLNTAVSHTQGINKDLFGNLVLKKKFSLSYVVASGDYVSTYVHLIHYVEVLYKGEDNGADHIEHKY